MKILLAYVGVEGTKGERGGIGELELEFEVCRLSASSHPPPADTSTMIKPNSARVRIKTVGAFKSLPAEVTAMAIHPQTADIVLTASGQSSSSSFQVQRATSPDGYD